MKGRKGKSSKEVLMNKIPKGEWQALQGEKIVVRAESFDSLVDVLKKRNLLGKVVVTKTRPYLSVVRARLPLAEN